MRRKFSQLQKLTQRRNAIDKGDFMQTHSQILSVHLGTELKQRWKLFCNDQNVTPSAGVRQIICKLTQSKVAATFTTREIADTPDLSRRRVEIRLTDSEYATLKTMADHRGMSPNNWAIGLIRANLTHSAQFGMGELKILGESNSQLLAIGRNLNQIARWMNANDGRVPLDKDRIDALNKMIREHTTKVNLVMRANIDRWVIK